MAAQALMVSPAQRGHPQSSSSTSSMYAVDGFVLDPTFADDSDNEDEEDDFEDDMLAIMRQQTNEEELRWQQRQQQIQAESAASSSVRREAPAQQPPQPTIVSLPKAADSDQEQRQQCAGPSAATPVQDDGERRNGPVDLDEDDDDIVITDFKPGLRTVLSQENPLISRIKAEASEQVSTGGSAAVLPNRVPDSSSLQSDPVTSPALAAEDHIPVRKHSRSPAPVDLARVGTPVAGGLDAAAPASPAFEAPAADAEATDVPLTAAQKFWTGHQDIHNKDTRQDPRSALEHLCALLPNADRANVLHINQQCYDAAVLQIYSTIELNGPSHRKLRRVLEMRPELAAPCHTVRVWHDGAIVPADSPDKGNQNHRFDYANLETAMTIIEARSQRENLGLEIVAGISIMQQLVTILRGDENNPRGCPRLAKNVRQLKVIEDLDWNFNVNRHRDGWKALLDLFKLLGGKDKTMASIEELSFTSAGDFATEQGKGNRTAPFLWGAFGRHPNFAFEWPALRQLVLCIRDAKHFNQLGDMRLPSLRNLAIDAATIYAEAATIGPGGVITKWDTSFLDTFLNENPLLESITIQLQGDHHYEGELFTSYHPQLKFTQFAVPPRYVEALDAFLERHQPSLISISVGDAFPKLESLHRSTFPSLRLLDVRWIPLDILRIPAQSLSHLACTYDALLPKPLIKNRDNGPFVKPSGAGMSPGKPRRDQQGNDVNPNSVSKETQLLEAEIPRKLSIPTLQTITSLEVVMAPDRFPELTMASSTVFSSRIFPFLMELKVIGERPESDRRAIFLKKTPLQQLLVGLSDALALRAVTLENFCDYLPDDNFIGPLCAYGPALEYVAIRTCGLGTRIWQIVRHIPQTAGTRQILGIGGDVGREYDVNRPVSHVVVVPSDDFHFSTMTDTTPADAWKDFSFFPHWNDVERVRLLQSTREAAMIGTIAGAETHHISKPNRHKAEASKDCGLFGSPPATDDNPSQSSKRPASQRTAARQSGETTAQMFAEARSTKTRAALKKTKLERAYATSRPRSGLTLPEFDNDDASNSESEDDDVVKRSIKKARTSLGPSSRPPISNGSAFRPGLGKSIEATGPWNAFDASPRTPSVNGTGFRPGLGKSLEATSAQNTLDAALRSPSSNRTSVPPESGISLEAPPVTNTQSSQVPPRPFRPGLGKSLEVAMQVNRDMVDLTFSSREPTPAAAAPDPADEESDGFEILD